ncbi:MAG: ABC transporter substrate-binding protein [Chloroflexi bacterium]|nr:ABC transporter substrate-binding protein [Chloroflexota bacterium]
MLSKSSVQSIVGISLVVILVVGVLVSCGGQTATPAPPTPAPATESSSKAASAPTVSPKPTPESGAPKSGVVPAPKSAAESSAAPTVVKVGITGSLVDAQIYIGADKGYFNEQGTQVDLIKFDSGGRMISALATGDLDIGTGGIGAALFNAIQRGIPLKVVADKSTVVPGFGVVGLAIRKDHIQSGRFKDFPDLKGFRMGIPAKGVSADLHARKALDLGKLTEKDVELIEMGWPDLLTALAGKSLDASILIEPFVTFGVEQGTVVYWKSSDQFFGNHETSVVMYSPQFVQRHPDLAKKWMVGYIKACRDLVDAYKKNQGRKEVIATMAKHVPIKDPTVYERMIPPYVNPDGYVDAKGIATDQAAYVKLGMVPTPIDLSKVIDQQYVEYAIEKLGKYQ